MADLQVVFLQDLLPVYRVSPIDTTDIPSLRIKGSGLTSAVAVLINGIESPLFISTNKDELVAEVPSRVVGDSIRSVAVISNRVLKTEKALISFRLGGSSSKVSGILRLVQRFVLLLLSTPGSDLLRPEVGGGLMKLVGRTMSGSEADSGNLQSSVHQSISKTTSDLKRLQASGGSRLQQSEILLDAVLTHLSFDPITTTLAVRVQLTSAAGEAALANLFV